MDSYTDSIEAMLGNVFAGSNGGMVIGLIDEHGSRIWSKGRLDNRTQGKVDGDTVFEIGSVTKVFTALLALDMDRRGEWDLDDPVSKYLPNTVKLPAYDGQEITIRNLAAQDSGLPFHPDSFERILKRHSGNPALKELKAAADAYTADDLYAFLSGHTLTEPPGTRFQYSNVGMAVLGQAMALRSGESFDSLVVNRISRPLGMDSTRITVSPEMRTRLARGHWADGSPADNVRFQVMASAGAMVSTVNDLLKFLSANLGFDSSDLTPLMLEMQVVQHTGEPRFGTTAMPWLDDRIYQPPGSRLLGHGGGGLGYLAFIGMDTIKRRGVVILSSQIVMNPSGIGWTILQGMPLSQENISHHVREVVGVGMMLDSDPTTGQVRIGGVYPESPAGKAGLSRGLLIQKVNGASADRMTPQQCLGLIAGPAGESVDFQLLNTQKNETQTVTLIRQPFITAMGEPFQRPDKIGAWDLESLHRAPEMRWASRTGAVHSLLYAGEPYAGHSTEVFAFFASPATLGEVSGAEGQQEKFPGVVLIHGGGGTAFAEWAWLWAKRGYAAIAMDLSGSRPPDPVYGADGVPVKGQAAGRDSRTRLPNGGPDQGPLEKFDSIGGEVSDDWPYHAVASVMRAHSLLRSFPEVEADRTAVTGISWGGYATCLVASVDDRFRAAVPVYGCGFLFEGESVQKKTIDKLGDRREDWIKAYDPSSLLVRCRVPILFVNGTNDIHYPLDSYQKSFDVVPGRKQIRIEVNMRHGHAPGWEPPEIGLFIDSFCLDGKPLPVPGVLRLEGDQVRLSYTSAVPLKSVALHYSTDAGPRSERIWQTLPGEIGDGVVTTPKPPDDVNTWFIAVTDQRDAMVTSPVQFSLSP